MQETLRHKEAFEYYYSLGDKRSLIKVGEKFKVSEQSLCKWNKNFGWQNRVKERDEQNAIELAKKTDKIILKTKAEYHKEVQDSLTLIRAGLSQIAEKIKAKTFKAETAKDLSTLIRAQDAAIRLEQLLAGGADSREEHKIIVEHVYPEDRKQVASEIIDGR